VIEAFEQAAKANGQDKKMRFKALVESLDDDSADYRVRR
jgi:hypothetical protein